ncbi:pectate lyase [Luteolibacter arcticus]|uniref:Pectate lyase n=1 Tax=Luteolibacter arcticus TaxID=1581411 RepID=A0ABT3GN64_9BACT|nr:pectate lyase [Luteolibacter arcticus]MCW1924961.1 pectate lyase [Luteolibacter arcticus]
MKRYLIPLALVFFPAVIHAAPVTAEAVGRLPAAEKAAWTAYLDRSKSLAATDQAALQAELEKSAIGQALKAPSGGDFKLSADPGDAWFSSDEAKALADVILSYQTPAGGWSKHTGYARGKRQPGMLWSSQYEPGKSPHYLGTFDNRSTTEQMKFLAHTWQATQREDCKAGFVRGLNYLLAAQYPNGGWPQVYPLEGGYHDNITFNDDAMTHVLEVLQMVSNNDPACAFLDDAMRSKATAAFDKGIACVLKMQIVQSGKKTAWCAQHDPLTLAPAEARAMEPAALSGMESATLLKFLMSLPNPNPELVASIDSGLTWLDAVKVTGLKRAKLEGKTAFVADAASTEVFWARFYRLTDNQPIFPGRDGVLYTSFNDMAAHNSLGYDYLSSRPGSVATNAQKKWRKAMAKRTEN